MSKKQFEIHYKRIENCRVIVEAKDKKEAERIFQNCEYDLYSEKVDEFFNRKLGKIVEVKNE